MKPPLRTRLVTQPVAGSVCSERISTTRPSPTQCHQAQRKKQTTAPPVTKANRFERVTMVPETDLDSEQQTHRVLEQITNDLQELRSDRAVDDPVIA